MLWHLLYWNPITAYRWPAALRLLSAVGPRQDGRNLFIGRCGMVRYSGPFGVNPELHNEIEQYGDRLAILEGGLKGGFLNRIDRAFVQAKADGPAHGDLARLAVRADDDVVERHSGHAGCLRVLV